MIKSYINSVHSKPPHERRAHALQLATGLTGMAVVVWVTTLGLRFASTPQQTPGTDINQMASVVTSQQGNAQLEVATTTDNTSNGTYFNQ